MNRYCSRMPPGRFCIFQGTTQRRTHSCTFMLVKHRRHAVIPQHVHSDVYLRKLFERQLEAAFVVGDTLGGDALHGFFKQPLIADVGLHQVLEARRVCCLVIELEGRGKEG